VKQEIKKNKFMHVDGLIVFATMCLIFLGTVMVYSASSPIAAENFGNHTYYLKKHILMLFLGLISMFFGFYIPLQVLKKHTFPMRIRNFKAYLYEFLDLVFQISASSFAKDTADTVGEHLKVPCGAFISPFYPLSARICPDGFKPTEMHNAGQKYKKNAC
jgi:hypothetical protein